MKHLVLAMATFAVSTVFAQPTLDAGSAPAPGNSYVFVVADPVTLSGVGAGQVWNASGALQNTDALVDLVATSSSSASASFPGADVVVAADGSETFIDVASDGLYILGSYNPGLPVTSVYSDPYLYLQYPCTLGTAWSDTYAGSYTYNGDTYAQSGSGTYEATGYGSLVLPWGTVDNVLRVDGSETYEESGNGNSYVYDAVFTYYYKPGVGYFVARSIDASATFNGAPAGMQQAFLFLEQNSIGMGEQAAASIGMEVFPNPAKDEATLLFTAEGTLSLQVIDGAGRTVLQRSLPRAGAGLFRETLDVSGLSDGLYTAIVSGTDGQRGAARFLVQH
jgi:hypothetical protein